MNHFPASACSKPCQAQTLASCGNHLWLLYSLDSVAVSPVTDQANPSSGLPIALRNLAASFGPSFILKITFAWLLGF